MEQGTRAARGLRRALEIATLSFIFIILLDQSVGRRFVKEAIDRRSQRWSLSIEHWSLFRSMLPLADHLDSQPIIKLGDFQRLSAWRRYNHHNIPRTQSTLNFAVVNLILSSHEFKAHATCIGTSTVLCIVGWRDEWSLLIYCYFHEKMILQFAVFGYCMAYPKPHTSHDLFSRRCWNRRQCTVDDEKRKTRLKLELSW